MAILFPNFRDKLKYNLKNQNQQKTQVENNFQG